MLSLKESTHISKPAGNNVKRVDGSEPIVQGFWFIRHLNSLCALVIMDVTAVSEDARDYTLLLVH